MSDFTVKQGDTLTLNYQIPGFDLSLKDVYFCFGDKRTYSKRIKCKRQSVSPQNYVPLHNGGTAIPLKGEDLDKAGFFFAQFEIISKNGEKRTYPQEGYLRMEVQQSI